MNLKIDEVVSLVFERVDFKFDYSLKGIQIKKLIASFKKLPKCSYKFLNVHISP